MLMFDLWTLLQNVLYLLVFGFIGMFLFPVVILAREEDDMLQL